MYNRKKVALRMLPSVLLSGGLLMGTIMKITGMHPMTPHFAEMGLKPYLPLLGCIEIVCVSLFLCHKTIKVGLLLLTAYFGGAMAAEIPYNMIAAPATVLVLVWIAAFVRSRALFTGTSMITLKS